MDSGLYHLILRFIRTLQYLPEIIIQTLFACREPVVHPVIVYRFVMPCQGARYGDGCLPAVVQEEGIERYRWLC